jgi:hypothetical protein
MEVVMMPDVVLLYERSCPNVRAARASLMRAFSAAKLPAQWREVDVDAPDTPAEWRAFGSPTVLVDGMDVGDGTRAEGAACRLYDDRGRLVRAPAVDRIAASLRAYFVRVAPPSKPARRSGLRTALAALPGVGIALLPKLACPACWPAYAAVLSALGLGFLMHSRYLLPITIALLALATFAIGFRARARRGYAPAIIAAVAAVAIVLAKFVLDSDSLTYGATAIFASAAIWNAWPVRKAAACPACVSESTTQTS